MSVLLPTILEFSVLVLIVFGFINEEKVASFERRVVRAIKRRSLKLIMGGGKQTAKKRCV